MSHAVPNAVHDTQAKARPRLALVDGSGYIFRAYHALPPLTRRDGTPVGAVYGFTSMLMNLVEKLEVEYLAVIFDAARKTFRNDIYPQYKANRDDPPDDLVPQFALVREATDALNIARIQLDNYEADDLIASYAKAATAQGWETMIVSSDKDLMQLIDDHVWMHDPMKNKQLDAQAVHEKFGVTPDKVIEVQALIGDSVDNIPGVPGIGPKTAAQLIDEFGSLEAVLANAASIKQNKRRESLIEHADAARLSYELVKLKDDIALPLAIESLHVTQPEPEKLLHFLALNEFKSLVTKTENRYGVSADDIHLQQPGDDDAHDDFAQTDYSLVQSEAQLREWIAKAEAAGAVAIDTETTSLDAMTAELVGISLSVQPGEACYIALAHVAEQSVGGQGQLFGEDDSGGDSEFALVSGQLPRERVLELLGPLLVNPAVLKIGQNIKYDLLVLKKYGTDISPIDDSMLLSYVTAAGLHAHNMDELSQLHLGHKPIAFKDVVGSGKKQKTFAQVELETAKEYAAEDADITLRLHQKLKSQLLADRLVSVYEAIERPLVPVLVDMEQAGIRVDAAKLQSLSREFELKMADFEKEIHVLAGRSFNVGSPKQLGEVLYDDMQLEGGKKSSKTGAYSTGAEVLEELAAGGVEIAGKVLDWRQLSKLKSTYTDALHEQINPTTQRVHTSYSMAGTTTGRLSSSDPNLQNIPIRTTEGKRIREAFIAADGCKLISADYSQIELRLLAHIAEIDVLKQAFKDGRDIHATTASQMFGVPLDAVESDLRRKAKTINFGIIYGISAHGLAQRLGIGRAEAADYIKAYFEQYPGIQTYMERTKEIARKQGYVCTLFGRRVYVKDINAKNPNLRAFSERAAINAPLQGTAADIIKRAMLRVHASLSHDFPQARMLLQVHDELIIEAPESHAQAVADCVTKHMSAAAHLSVPLLVEAGIGNNWGEIH